MNRTTHPIEREEVMAWLDGELDAARAAIVEAHVGECGECRALAEELGAVSARMAEWQVEPAPARAKEGVMDAIPSAQVKPPKLNLVEGRPAWLLGWRWKLAGAFALAVLVVGIYVGDILYLAPMRLEKSPMQESRQVLPMEAPDQAAYGASVNRAKRMQEEFAKAVAAREKIQAPEAAGPMIIRTASLTIVTKDFENTRAAVEQVVRKHGGYIAQLTASRPNEGAKGLTATVRVPAQKLDAALAELKTLGRVENETVSGEEVTQQYVDLVARLANARQTEQRLVEVLRTRTGKVSEVLEVEQEIARVREEIERMEAQRKNLEKQVQFATVNLRIAEEFRAQLAPPRPSVTTQMWNAAVAGYESVAESSLGLVLFLLSYGPPMLFWGAVLFWPARYVWRRLRTAAV